MRYWCVTWDWWCVTWELSVSGALWELSALPYLGIEGVIGALPGN